MIVVLVVGALVGWAMALFIGRQIVRPLQRVKASLDALALGDLTDDAQVHTADEVGQMATALAQAQQSLREVLAAMASSADAVAASSDELSASSAQISASAEETSAQSGVVSSAAEEVSRKRADRRRRCRADGCLDPGDRIERGGGQ